MMRFFYDCPYIIVCSFFLTKKNQKVKAGIAELKNVPSRRKCLKLTPAIASASDNSHFFRRSVHFFTLIYPRPLGGQLKIEILRLLEQKWTQRNSPYSPFFTIIYPGILEEFEIFLAATIPLVQACWKLNPPVMPSTSMISPPK